jgi:hypothetical protein
VLIALAICWFGLAACSSKVTSGEPARTTPPSDPVPSTTSTSALKPSTASSNPASSTSARPGDPDVYVKIQASASCVELQNIFDRADVDRKAALERKNIDLAMITLAYMVAASTRMNELGCP